MTTSAYIECLEGFAAEVYSATHARLDTISEHPAIGRRHFDRKFYPSLASRRIHIAAAITKRIEQSKAALEGVK